MKVAEIYEQKQICKMCSNDATQQVVWANGNGYIPVCDDHVDDAKALIKKRGEKVNKVVPVSLGKPTR